MEIPLIAVVHQRAEQPVINDMPGEVRRQWRCSTLRKRVRRGDRVAVAVGSRGIANLAAESAELWVSPPLVEEARRMPGLEVLGVPQPVPFTAGGHL